MSTSWIACWSKMVGMITTDVAAIRSIDKMLHFSCSISFLVFFLGSVRREEEGTNGHIAIKSPPFLIEEPPSPSRLRHRPAGVVEWGIWRRNFE